MALSHVVVREQPWPEVVEGGRGHGGRGLHDEARRRGGEAEAGPAQLQLPSPPPAFLPGSREQGREPTQGSDS